MYCKDLAFETRLENKTVQVTPTTFFSRWRNIAPPSLVNDELDTKLRKNSEPFLLKISDINF